MLYERSGYSFPRNAHLIFPYKFPYCWCSEWIQARVQRFIFRNIRKYIYPYNSIHMSILCLNESPPCMQAICCWRPNLPLFSARQRGDSNFLRRIITYYIVWYKSIHVRRIRHNKFNYNLHILLERFTLTLVICVCMCTRVSNLFGSLFPHLYYSFTSRMSSYIISREFYVANDQHS